MNRKKILSLTLITLLINLGLDRVTKWVAVTQLQGQPPISILHGFIVIQYAENTGGFLSLGAAWPMPLKYSVFLVIPAVICVCALIYCLVRETFPGRAIIISTIVGGGLGNLFDRMVQGFMVVDFLNFGIGPVRTGILNVADLSITFGAIAFLWYEWRKKRSVPSFSKELPSLGKCVAQAMDSHDETFLPYLPYILQDFWEIGSQPDVIIEKVQNHFPGQSGLRVLDLGCGKGAVSIRLAHSLHCHCTGYDAIGPFVHEARLKAKEWGVDPLCAFHEADIRKVAPTETEYDVVVLGSVGPVFGDYFETLSALSGCLREGGVIMIDDAFIDDASSYSHPRIQKRASVMEQIQKAGMVLVEEYIHESSTIQSDEYQEEYRRLSERCEELMAIYPEKTGLFEAYRKQQKEEYQVLEDRATCALFVIRALR